MGCEGQWRVQDFPWGGGNSQSGCANLFFSENYMKIKEFGAPLDPPMKGVLSPDPLMCRLQTNILSDSSDSELN